jgi:hypothetical protein
MLAHFFRHYDPWVDRYFVLDNGSTDDSLAILEAQPRVTVRHFDVTGDSFVEVERRLSDTVWRKSRGRAEWVMLIDIDEFIYHPDLVGYLTRCADEGVTAVRGIGYEMVSDHFPTDSAPLVESVTLGVRSAGHDKLCVFNPNALTDTGFAPGRHKSAPVGRVHWPDRPELLLLHYKQLGADYVVQRSAELHLGLREGDVEQGWGKQYQWSAAEISDQWAKLKSESAPVPGLGILKQVAPAHYDQEHAIAQSGLFDSAWYLGTYPDIGAADADALSHFCIHGWKEDRRPNLYFHPAWYLANHPEAAASGRNPLLHYLASGERDGLRPSPWFDPAWYRKQYKLDVAESPLRHYLANRTSGLYSPNADFDVGRFRQEHPRWTAGTQDPFEEHLRRAHLPSQEAPMEPTFPSYPEVVSMLGVDPQESTDPVTVEPAALVELLQRFLSSVEVDAAWYRRTYPDVAAALDDGSLASARQHFIEYGYFEGRSPRAAAIHDT